MHTTAIQLLSVSRPTVYQVTDPRRGVKRSCVSTRIRKYYSHFTKKVRLGIHLSTKTPETKASDSLFVPSLCINDDLATLLKPSSALQTLDKYITKGGHWREYSAFLAQFRQLVKVEEDRE